MRTMVIALAVSLTAGCVPTGGGDDGDAAAPLPRDAERLDATPTDGGVEPDGGDADDEGVDAEVEADDGVDLDGEVEPDAAIEPDAAVEPDMAPPPPCEDGETRPCPDCDGATQTCVDGAWGDCIGALEQCDGLDNDCDGAVDEDFPDLGDDCSIGTGECRGEGTIVCGMEGTRCTARPGRPTFERCDDLDNDCDGSADEDFDVGEPCTVGVGECARDGNVVCDPEGPEAVCDAALIDPIVELCDGVDNDCDGVADEGFDVGAPCAEGDGACRNEGEVVCLPDGAAACSVEAGDPAADERCNAIDDDCDGAVDEGLAVGEACLIGEGDCQVPGRVECNAAEEAVCEALPDNAEACDGADNDCDGLIDEDFRLGEPCLAGGGVCQAPGTRACAPDGGEACVADEAPVLGVGDGDDGEVVVGAGEVLQLEARPYEFVNLTIAQGGVVRGAPLDPEAGTGGRSEIRVQGLLHVQAGGTLDLVGAGHRGGPPNPKVIRDYPGIWTNNGGTTGFHGGGPGGGGGGFAAPQVTVGSGGGGGHATPGAAGTPCGADARNYTVWDNNIGMPVPIAAPDPVFSSAGAAYADPQAGEVTLGSGGGSGGNNYDGGAAGIGGPGGAGGGGLLIVADRVQVDGAIRVDGAAGVAGNGGSYVGGGGGGAGGSVYIAANSVTVGGAGQISAAGGAGAPGAQNRGVGGQGGAGWVRIDTAALQQGGQVVPAVIEGEFVCAGPE